MYGTTLHRKPNAAVTRTRGSEDALHCEIGVTNGLPYRNADYVRLGEWFFIPQPDLEIPFDKVERNGELVRGAGQPQRVEWLYRTNDPGRRTYALGHVSHGDHTMIKLDVWHRVVMNPEAVAIVRQSSAILNRRTLPRLAMSYLD